MKTPVVFSSVQTVTSPLLGGAVRSRRCTWNAAVLHFRPPDAQSFAPLFQGLVWFNVSGKGPLLFSTCGRGLHRGECRGFRAFSPVGCRVRCGASDERSRPRRVFPVQVPSCPSAAGRLGLTIIPLHLRLGKRIVPICVRGG